MSRYRETKRWDVTHLRILETSDAWNDIISLYSTANSSKSGSQRTIDDEVHPRFRKRVNDGEVILGHADIQDYSRSYTDCDLQTGPYGSSNYRVDMSGDCAAYCEAFLSNPPPLDCHIQSLREASLIKAYAKIRDGIMLGEPLTDLVRTVNALTHPFNSARTLFKKAFKQASKHYGRSATSVIKANAKAWLEYRYALKPVLLDINQGIKMVHRKRDVLERRRLVARACTSGAKKISQSWYGQSIPVWSMQVSGSGTIDQKVMVHGGVVYEVAHRTRSQQLSEDLQLGVDSLPQLAWEKLPFSFVADWFVNVGDWLAAINLPPSVSVKGNWTSLVNEVTWTLNSGVLYLPVTLPPGGKTGSTGGSVRTLRQLHRNVNQPLPTLPVMVSRWRTMTHAVDALSLIVDGLKTDLRKLRH